MSSTHTTRSSIRKQRRALTPEANRHHGEAVARKVARLRFFSKSKHIGVYLSVNGELDTKALIRLARKQGKSVYLPVLHPFLHGRLLFCRWKSGDRLVRNSFGIEEPVRSSSRLVWLRKLDLVIVPLVAFDKNRNRIGMGGGYYDRTFGYAKSFRRWKRPILVGVAHHFQQVEWIDASPWDVPLDLVVTERSSV